MDRKVFLLLGLALFALACDVSSIAQQVSPTPRSPAH